MKTVPVHGMLFEQTAEQIHVEQSRGFEDGTRAQKERPLEHRMIQQMEKRAAETERRHDNVGAGCPQKSEAEPDAHDSHVFDTGIGEKPFQVLLCKRENHASRGAGKPEPEKGPSVKRQRAVLMNHKTRIP